MLEVSSEIMYNVYNKGHSAVTFKHLYVVGQTVNDKI